jgi:hypothetical protein
MSFRNASMGGLLLVCQTLLLFSQTTDQANPLRYSNELPKLHNNELISKPPLFIAQ